MTLNAPHVLDDAVPCSPNALVDADAQAVTLSVPASWLLREARAGRIPHVRLGKYVRFHPPTVEAWWRERMAGPVPRTGSQPVSDARKGQR
jgi:excisionase family DNA binding protein